MKLRTVARPDPPVRPSPADRLRGYNLLRLPARPKVERKAPPDRCQPGLFSTLTLTKAYFRGRMPAPLGADVCWHPAGPCGDYSLAALGVGDGCGHCRDTEDGIVCARWHRPEEPSTRSW